MRGTIHPIYDIRQVPEEITKQNEREESRPWIYSALEKGPAVMNQKLCSV